MPRLKNIREDAIAQLKQVAIDTARLDVDLLLEAVSGLGALDIMLEPDQKISAGKVGEFDMLLKRRIAREPISQILGRKDFWSLSFKVSRHCLTPRPDSETLIEAALKILPDTNIDRKILDLGTGSGCLLLSLLSEWPNSFGLGLDLSDKALACARENAQRLGFSERCDFMISDWTEKLPSDLTFDVVLCNPPYIAESEKMTLEVDVRDYEPHMALFAEDEGLREYKRLAKLLPGYVSAGGVVFMEIGHRQAAAVVRIFKKTPANNIRIIQDLAGRDRCIVLNY